MKDDQSDEYEECKRKAIKAGALRAQGLAEKLAAGLIYSDTGVPFENSPLAQARLNAWIDDCMNGRPFRKLK